MTLRTTLMTSLMILFSISASAYEGDGVVEADEDETAELARAVQNPVANLISVPFQNNTSYNFGPRERTQKFVLL